MRIEEPLTAEGASEVKDFDSSPPGLANAWIFYLRGRKPRIDDQPPLSGEFFAELLKTASGPAVLAEIKRPDRNRSEQLFHFANRLTRAPPRSNNRQLSKTEIAEADRRARAATDARLRKAGLLA